MTMDSTKQIPTSLGSSRQGIVMDLVVLTKLELTGLSVLTALCAFYIASDALELARLLWTALGTWLLGAGAAVFNQHKERTLDGLMRRTERRPLPAGRMRPSLALALGIVLGSTGSVVLYLLTSPLAMLLGLATVGIYVLVYTPLKRWTPLATAVGAIPGAMPPLIGWAAARGELELGAWLLFGLVYLWQMPHFLAIAWMYQKDYLRAGFRVLSVSDLRGIQTGVIVLLSTAALLVESLLFYFAGLTGLAYLLVGIVAGVAFLLEAWRFFVAVTKGEGSWLARANQVSRRLFFASLIYLPVAVGLLVLDKR